MPPQIDGTWTWDHLRHQESDETPFCVGKSIQPGCAHWTLSMCELLCFLLQPRGKLRMLPNFYQFLVQCLRAGSEFRTIVWIACFWGYVHIQWSSKIKTKPKLKGAYCFMVIFIYLFFKIILPEDYFGKSKWCNWIFFLNLLKKHVSSIPWAKWERRCHIERGVPF